MSEGHAKASSSADCYCRGEDFNRYHLKSPCPLGTSEKSNS
jgi:hypothetical protein